LQIRDFLENIVLHYVWQIDTIKSDFFTQNAYKAFGDRASHRPARRAYSVPTDIIAGFKEAASRRKRTEKGEQRTDKKGDHPLPPILGSAIFDREITREW